MSTQKGNQKHLNLSDRINIEKGLNNNDSFATIAKVVQKDPTTISKEVRKHSKVKEYKGYANTPCEANKDKHSPCMLKHVCGDLECDRICRQCPKQRCSDICEAYRPQQCPKLSKAPYVCNGCGKRVNCMMEKKIYSSKYADDCYRETLSSSREGINQTPESIQKMNDILTPLIQKGQSIAHIYATHAEDLGCSKRTTYTYIDAGVFDVRNIDLRRKVKYKKRKKATNTSARTQVPFTVNRYRTKRMNELTGRRNRRIKDQFHKISRQIADYAKDNRVDVVIMGHNVFQKQEIDIGHVNNQNFVQIPMTIFAGMLKYKLAAYGIRFAITEESYTFKADFLALDPIPVYNKDDETGYNFSGKRIKRGLYRHYDGTVTNADINGAANILRKVFPKVTRWDRGIVDMPCSAGYTIPAG